MTTLTTHAAWVLVVTFTLSLLYEVYRTTVKSGTSRHDSTRAFAQGFVIYVIAAVVVARGAALLRGRRLHIAELDMKEPVEGGLTWSRPA